MGIYILILLLVSGIDLFAQDITVTGDWYLTIDATDLKAGPGSNLIGTHRSTNNQVIVDISQVVGFWSVSVRAVQGKWPQDVVLALRRKNNGKGSGWISGGTSWIDLTSFDQRFFIGYEDRKNIKVKCRVKGISVDVPPETYSTTVVYTLTDY